MPVLCQWLQAKKLGIILDLKHLNLYLAKLNFNNENLRFLSERFKQNFGFFMWDSKSGYHNVHICKFYRELHGFVLGHRKSGC